MKSIKWLPIILLGLIELSANAADFSSFDYRNIGPTRGGRVTAVAGTVQEPGTFYIGATGGGVWKTTDYGTTWNPISDKDFATPSIGDIAVAQNDKNIIYVGTGSDGLRSNVIPGKGVYKSIDAGENWQHIGLDETGHIGAVEIDPRNHNVVWVAAIGNAFKPNKERGLFKSTDGGRSWEKKLYLSNTVGITDVEMLPGNPDIVLATAWLAERKPWTIVSGGPAEQGGIFKSVDGGETWRKVSNGLPNDLIGKIDLAVSPADSSLIYALVEAPEDEGGLYKSVDQGENWEQVSSHRGIRTRPFYYTNIDVDPKNPDVLWAMATGYFKSEDGGKTWKSIKVPHGDNHDMWINPDNPDLFIQANDGGVNVTHNGGKTWSTQFNQATAELYQVEVDDQYPYWLYAGQQDNSTTIAVPSMPPYNKQHPIGYMVDTGGCETGPAVPKPGNHNIVYSNCKGRFGVFDKRLGTERGYYVGAANMYGHNPKDLRYRFQRVSPIHVSPHDSGVVYHASQYVHRTTDEGQTWETISGDLSAFEDDKQVISGSPITRDITGEEFYSTIYSLRESTIKQGVIWVGANDGPVHVSQDNGESWQDVTPKRLPKGGRVDSVDPSPHDPAKAYIAVHRYLLGDDKPYIYRTDNYGKSWTLLTSGKNGIPSDVPTRVVREDPVKEGLLFAGTEFGMYVSLDDGDNWHKFQQNLPVIPITDLKIIRSDVAISTMGRSFWVLDNISTLRQDNFTGEGLALFQPKDTILYRKTYRHQRDNPIPEYPEPAVIIDYRLPPNAEQVSLTITDNAGNVVNRYNSQQPEGGASADDTSATNESLMRSGETAMILSKALKTDAGMQRFRWNMRHLGAWHSDEGRRYSGGPVVAPGRYNLILQAGDSSVSTTVNLSTDPRVALTGTSAEDIRAQVELQLGVVELLSAARQLESELKAKASLSDREQAQLDVLQTPAGIYMLPGLTNQIRYLYNMISKADQAPGKDALDRFEVLKEQFAAIR